MAETREIGSKKADPEAPKNFFSFFPKFELQLPFLKPGSKSGAVGKKDREAVVVVGEEREEVRTAKPDVVRFPRTELVVPPPLEAEAEEAGKTSNPVVIWQVYALGGFLVLRWIWARWNERRAQKGSDGKDDDGDGNLSGHE